jgi:hypothetical protein
MPPIKRHVVVGRRAAVSLRRSPPCGSSWPAAAWWFGAVVACAETPKFSNLSPYNSGSQSKSRRISNQLDYNQDRIIQHNTSHVTFHKYLREAYNTSESQLLQTRFRK